VVAGAGHMLPYERPEKVIELIDRFFNKPPS
jgi:pimeloyl-ACP methyl ester carboxylesterase